MKETKRLDTYRIIRALLYIGPFLMVAGVKRELDNDTYWIIKTGEYIANNGIPTKDILSFHTSMDLVIQQWLSSVIFYRLHQLLGVAGPVALAMLMFVVAIALMHRLTSIITDGNRVVSALVVFAVGAVLCRYAVTRPQIFTYVIVLTELIMLERYVRTGRWQYLIVLPVLSVLEVNLHASMWTMLFIVMMPYIANALPVKLFGKSISCCNIVPLILTAIAMVGTGLITPYGVKGMTFLFTTSVGDKLNGYITELTPITLSADSLYMIALVILGFVMYAYYLKAGRVDVPLRVHLMFLGTLAMGLKYYKLFPYFMIAGLSLGCALAADWRPRIIAKFSDPKFNALVGGEIIFFVLLFIAAGCMSDTLNVGADEPTQAQYMACLQEMVDTIDADTQSTDDVVIYNGFNSGGYLEFRGYKAYIDARADSFIPEANHDYDYLTEYQMVKKGQIYYRDFVDRYDFTHLLIEKGDDDCLATALSHDDDYQQIGENDMFVLYKAV